MKDKIQILLSMVVCLMVAFSMNAQTFDFNPGGTTTDNAGGTDANGNNCSDGFLEFTTTVTVDEYTCPEGTVLNSSVGDGVLIDNVTVDLDHTWDGDVTLTLVSPGGVPFILTDGNGGSGENYTGTIFTDAGTLPITSGSSPFTGAFTPQGGSFATGSLAGEEANGDWMIQFCDTAGGDDGFFNEATITFAPNELACPIACELTCPDDQVINLEAGECSELVLFDAAVLGGDNLCMVAETFDIAGFQDGFGPDDATIMTTADGVVDVSGAPATIVTTGQEGPGTACYNMVAPVDGAFSVDWDHETADGSFWDPVTVTVDGTTTEVTANSFGAGTESGTFNANVTAGSTINLCQEFDGFAAADVSTTTWSNLQLLVAPGYVIEQTTGPASGDFGEAGVYTITYTATNNQDLTDVLECTSTITINEYSGPVLSALSCNDGVNISVDDACEVELGADIFLTGGPYACYDDYTVVIWPFGNENQAFEPVGPLDFSTALGTHTFQVFAPDGNNCWGEFTVEDKLGPAIECQDIFVNCIEPIPFGPAPGGETTLNVVLASGVQPAQNATTEYVANVALDAEIIGLQVAVDFEYENPTTSDAQLILTSPSGTEINLWDELNGCGGFINYIGVDGADAAAACANLQDGGTADWPTLAAGFGFAAVPYSTTYGELSGGDWTLTVNEIDGFGGDGGVLTINNVSMELIVSQEASMPSDNCGSVTVSSSDVVSQGSCETGVDRTIERTYIVTDQNGMSTTCTQTITVATIGVEDVTAPVTPIVLPCGTGTSPDEIVAFFDDPLTKDIALSASCQLDVIEKNEGIPYGYFNYPATGCDGNSYPQAVNNNVCNIYSTYTDQEIPTCAPGCSGNVKVIRTWTLLDWCDPSAVPFTFIQVIKSVDTEAPSIEAEGFSVSVNPWECVGDFSMPAPTLLHDLCTSDLSYTVSGPAGTTLLAPNTSANPSNFWVVFGAPKTMAGQPHIFTYTASDCCGNTSSAEVEVYVYDTTPPVPVATQNIIVNLTTGGQLDEDGNAIGIAKVYANSVDNGSYDGCSGVKVEIARESDACDVRGNATFNADGHPGDGSPNPNASNYDPDGGQYVKFCCADITDVDPVSGVEYGIVRVKLRVFDDGNMSGAYGDFVDNNQDGDVTDAGEYDNYNETWVDVRVEGKAVSSIVCPPDVTIACDEDYTDPTLRGHATTLALCGSESVDVTYTPQLNACGVGFVIATYTVAGSSPSISCNQRITVENPYPAFDPSTIRYPRNLPTSPTGQLTCTDDIPYDIPTWTAGPCDFIGYTEDVDTFFFEVDPNTGTPNDACFKILRSFTVIDWCVYDETNGQDGLYYGSQTIKITDRDVPVLADCNPVMFGVNDNNDANGNGNICERLSTTLTNSATDTGNCSSDWLKWQVLVDTWADGIVDYEYSSFLPSNDSNINNDTNGNGINDRYVAPTTSGEEVSIEVTEALESSMFNHIVEWKVTDGCGNVASCTTTFMVVDKKAPTPYCVSLSTALMENGGVELWAIDFDLGAFDNCTAQEDLRFTFSSTLPEDDSSYDPSQRSSAMTFTQAGTNPVDVYVFDEKGNYDFCTVMLTINDNNTGTSNGMRGVAATELGNGVFEANAVVEEMSGVVTEYPHNQMTNASGEFAFENSPAGYDYEITVNKNDNHSNGVSTLDLVLIQRHIIGLADLDSPYKVIAADINADDNLSAIDVVELRKVILGVQDEFKSNTSWRFVDATQTFADILSPFPVDETRNVYDLASDMMAEDFVAVKVGDVNATATNDVAGATSEVRSGNTMLLEVEDRAVVAGEQVEIAVSSADFKAVSGLQMTLEFNGLTFTDVTGQAIQLGASNVGVISDNVITMSWNTNTAVSTTDDLFVITALATKDGNISEMINVTDRVITPEVYVGSNLDVNNVELGIRGNNGLVLTNELLQNEPNPFKELTTISFNLATAGKATLTVRDVTGKLIRTYKGEYEAGLNTIPVANSDLNTVGVLYYTLESGDFSETKKMIIIE